MIIRLSALLITVLLNICCATVPAVKKSTVPVYPTTKAGEGPKKRPNGYVDLGDPAVYKLVTTGGTCSGTFVNDPRGSNNGILNDHILVSAYHCIEGIPAWALMAYVEIEGKRVYATRYEVAEGADFLVIHFTYVGHLDKLDIEPANHPSDLSILRQVGYGCPPFENPLSNGVVHSGVKRYNDFAPMYIGPSPAEPKDGNLLYIVAVDFSVCGGDSGGPVLSYESNKILSIVTREWFTYTSYQHVLGVETVNAAVAFTKLHPL